MQNNLTADEMKCCLILTLWTNNNDFAVQTENHVWFQQDKDK
jgi:hypothetical protein